MQSKHSWPSIATRREMAEPHLWSLDLKLCPRKACTMHQPHTLLSRDEIGRLVASGHKIIIMDGCVLKVDAWLAFHPGGDKAILHMVGRDATDEVFASVHRIVMN